VECCLIWDWHEGDERDCLSSCPRGNCRSHRVPVKPLGQVYARAPQFDERLIGSECVLNGPPT
jgi:hypothetical protein